MSETKDYDKSSTPTAHKTTHQHGGSDEISVAGLCGLLAYEQNAGAIKGITVPAPVAADDEKAITYDHDTLAFKYLAGGAAAHAITHQDGGIDEIDVTDLSGVLADQQPSEFSIVSGLLSKFQGLIAGNWTLRTPPADNNWFSVCWSPELSLFCAVAFTGTGNRVMTSKTGSIWTLRTSAADNNWFSVCWSPELSLFCAVAITGNGNRVMTSPDGIDWTIRTSPADNQWISVCWSPELSLFCAVAHTGTGNRVMTSPDGITWTIRTSPADNGWISVCWSPALSLFCAVEGV